MTAKRKQKIKSNKTRKVKVAFSHEVSAKQGKSEKNFVPSFSRSNEKGDQQVIEQQIITDEDRKIVCKNSYNTYDTFEKMLKQKIRIQKLRKLIDENMHILFNDDEINNNTSKQDENIIIDINQLTPVKYIKDIKDIKRFY